VGIAAIADPMIRVLLGEAWLGAAPVIVVLAIAAAFEAFQTHNGMAHVALGSPRLNAAISMARLVVLVPAAWFLAQRQGLIGVAYAELIAGGLCALLSLPFPFVRLRIAPWIFVARIWRVLAASLVLELVVKALLAEPLVVQAAPFLQLAVAIPVGFVSYVAAMLLLWVLCGRPAGAEAMILRIATEYVQRLAMPFNAANRRRDAHL
jgi:O-antigen/teichoic acid export membrane protein